MMRLLVLVCILTLSCFAVETSNPRVLQKRETKCLPTMDTFPATCSIMSEGHKIITEFPEHSDITFDNGFKMVLNQNFTFGTELEISGIIKEDVNRIIVDLLGYYYDNANRRKETIAMHFNPRFRDNVIIRNSFLNDIWGIEEKNGQFNLNRGESFNIRIVASVDGYNIWTNGKYFAFFKYRIGSDMVDHLNISGQLKLLRIVFKPKKNNDENEPVLDLSLSSNNDLENEKQIGGKNNPAKSCKYLSIAQPKLQSGDYWIDPNGGVATDAVVVWCNMETKSTCIKPILSTTEVLSCKPNALDELWLSEIDGGLQISYSADSDQIRALQRISTRATQNITYHCQNSVAYYDKLNDSYRNALKLMSWNDVLLSPRASQKLRYSAVVDECQHKSSDWAKTELLYVTDLPERLPIMDVAVRNVVEDNSFYSIKIGDVCFI